MAETTKGTEKTFRRLLVNTLVTGVTSTFMWFSLSFWVFIETRSVVATGVIAGIFTISSALLGPVFGTFVDRHRKHTAMLAATAVSALCFAGATAVYATAGSGDLLRLTNVRFWVLVAATLLGSVAGQVRGIALSTSVSLLVPEDRRDRANGMVGTVTGLSFALTSAFSGLSIGGLGMGWSYLIALGLMTLALVDLASIRFAEPQPQPASGDRQPMVDVRGALDAIRAVPGLLALMLLAAFNNLLSGVLMALMDGYGLSLVSVETWGLLLAFISLAFIGGGVVVARRGVGRNPVRLILTVHLVNWTVCSVFALRSSIVLLTIGFVVWLALFPVIEASEHTMLQRSIPLERQGRVFGFAQLLENAATPLTAFLMAPLAEVVFMPTMTDGLGADLIGGWFGSGPQRGIALMFTLAGLIGLAVTLIARSSRSLRQLDEPREDGVVIDLTPAEILPIAA